MDRGATPSLEALLTSPYAFGLTTATPLQRAVCRILDGYPLKELATHPAVLDALGPAVVAEYETDPSRPSELILLSAIRCAKSMICAAAVWRLSRTADLSPLAPNDPPARVPVLSVYKDNAAATYQHLLGALLNNPWMRATMIGEPTADTITIRHAKTGRPVEIKIVAGARAGTTVVSRWLAGLIFDEAPRMAGQDHVVNLHDLRNAALGRMLPGAPILYPGSPSAPYGEVYEMVQQHNQRPGKVMVVWAPGWSMNSVYWTPERVDAFRREHPEAYQTDCAAQFASPAENLYTADELYACARETAADSPRREGAHYVAAMDPATRGNSWTLVVATRQGRQLQVAAARCKTGTAASPLSPSAVLAEYAQVLRGYGVTTVLTDQWHADSLADIGRGHGLSIVQDRLDTEQRTRRALALKTRLQERMVELPRDPVLLGDLSRVQRVAKQDGGVAIKYPLTPDGRHCDYAPATLLALADWLVDMDPAPAQLTAEQRMQRMADQLKAAAIKRATGKRKAV